MEYHSFLSYKTYCNNFKLFLVFPSPCGALFILMGYGPKTKCKIKLFKVSVSLRSIIHFYLVLWCVEPKSSQVSVSLRSIIHSYPMAKKVFFCNIFLECYRVIFLFLKFFCLFQLKASLTPYFLNIV